MNQAQAVEMLRRSVDEWNTYRRGGGVLPSLNGADLRWADLSGAHLRGADLREADLSDSITLPPCVQVIAAANIMLDGHSAIFFIAPSCIVAVSGGCFTGTLDEAREIGRARRPDKQHIFEAAVTLAQLVASEIEEETP